MRNHGLCEMRASKTAHPRRCSKERLFSNRSVYIMCLLTYHSDLMREPCDVLLAAHRVKRHDAAFEPEGSGQLRNSGALVRLAKPAAVGRSRPPARAGHAWAAWPGPLAPHTARS